VLAAEEEGQNRLAALRDALAVLNPRERRIFEARRLSDEPMTLEDLSTEFGVSRERVRQIEVRAFEKVRTLVKRKLAARRVIPCQSSVCDSSPVRPYADTALAAYESPFPVAFVVLRPQRAGAPD
jgi:hypothetical protein